MPRAESTKMNGSFYMSFPPTELPKKKYVCPTCERGFTTSGHLARHTRIHTGERNHKCPFPGCETRCSRQDNLQQHYRIHLSPGSRRNSRRSGTAKRRELSNDIPPPALEDVYAHHLTPPDSLAPLVQATVPVADPSQTQSSRSSSLASDQPYYVMGDSSSSYASYSYRNVTTTYQEQGPGSGFTYVHTTPLASHDISRHSISHIMSYPAPASPASSNSASSHASGPPTPTYAYDEVHARYNTTATTASDHNHHRIYSADNRFQSPPPILAPVHNRDHFLPAAYLYQSCPRPVD